MRVPCRGIERGRTIKYVEGRADQFVDCRKKLSSYENFELVGKFRERGFDNLKTGKEPAFQVVGSSYSVFDGVTVGKRNKIIMLVLTCLAPVITLCFAGKIGMPGILILMLASVFAMVGIILIVGLISSVFTRKWKYSEEVDSNAVAYVRILRTSGRARFKTSPLFEYTYQGQTYQAMYDHMIDDSNADIDLGPVTIYIDPKHPESVYRNSMKVGVQNAVPAIICLGLAGVMSLVAIQAKLSAEYVEEPVSSSIFEISDGTITDEMVDYRIHSIVGHEDDEWYFRRMHVTITTYESGNYSIDLEDPAFPSICDEHDASYWHDELLIFYVVEERKESDGKIYIDRTPLLYYNADEYTYVGTHGADEG